MSDLRTHLHLRHTSHRGRVAATVLLAAALLALISACGAGTDEAAARPVASVTATERSAPRPNGAAIGLWTASTPGATDAVAVASPSPKVGSLSGKRICIDPGHEADAPGAANVRYGLQEHELTLAVAYKAKALLEQEGADVCVTRLADGLPSQPFVDEAGDGELDVRDRIQARIDWVNRFGADVLVSIHFNGHPDQGQSGTEVYYSDRVASDADNRRLANALLESVAAEIGAAGHAARSRGVHSDDYKDYGRLYTLGNNDRSFRGGQWRAGALVEVLFLSNPADAAFLAHDGSLDAAARGIVRGLLRFYESPAASR